MSIWNAYAAASRCRCMKDRWDLEWKIEGLLTWQLWSHANVAALTLTLREPCHALAVPDLDLGLFHSRLTCHGEFAGPC